MSQRRNSALKIYVNGRVADGLYGLSKRVGQTVSRMSIASTRAQASLARRVQPVTKREVRKVYGIKASALNSRMRLETGRRKKSDYLSIWASTRKLPLIDFGGSWGGRHTPGAVASILTGARKTYGSAFIATVGWRGTSGAAAVKDGTSSRNIYVRSQGPDGRRVGRGPLRMLKGPSVFEMIATQGSGRGLTVAATVLPQLQDYYVSELTRQIALVLRDG